MHLSHPHIITEETADGSCTLFVPELNEHYHSVKGALTESKHIFIDMGFKHCISPAPHILEIGFGTGLNAFLTLLESEKESRQTYYTGIEFYPLKDKTVQSLRYPEAICPERSENYFRLHTSDWGKEQTITPHFTLNKIEGDFTCYHFPPHAFDVIYFDAFAPEKQPEMWTQDLFNSLYNSQKEGGILTTYCAKGRVRRMLQAAGFTVERLPGPPAGKREILRATKL